MSVEELSAALQRELDKPPPAPPEPPKPQGYPYLSQSIATTLLNDSPAHAHLTHPMLGGVARKATKSMDLGTLLHSLVLTGELPEQVELLDFQNYRPVAAQTARDAAQARGKIPMIPRDLKTAYALAKEFKQRLADRGLTFTGAIEQRIRWTEESRGRVVQCEGTPDHVSPDGLIIDDLKFVARAHPDKIARHMVDYGCDVQWAAYTRAVRQNYGTHGRERMRFIFCDIVSPLRSIVVVNPSASMRQLGTVRWERAIETWADCYERQLWPGYAEEIEIDAPQYALAREMDNAGEIMPESEEIAL